VFEKVISLPQTSEGNIVVMAFKTRPVHDLEAMLEKAKRIRESTGLHLLQRWVRAIHKNLLL
jgi:hypothetical protein